MARNEDQNSSGLKKTANFSVKQVAFQAGNKKFNFSVGRKLGSGGYGDIHLGVDDAGTEVALKLGTANGRSMLCKEAAVYEQFGEYEGIPRVIGHGEAESCYVMAMQVLGQSLQDLLNDYTFNLKAALIIGVQALRHLEYIHSKNYIHGDIKPSNFLIGTGENRKKIYIIDLGLAKVYRTDDKKHVPYTTRNGFHGTPRYASIHTHMGIAPSRRDDLESLGYVLIYLLRASLPWQTPPTYNKKEGKKDKRKRITDMKKTMPLEELCRGLPEEFAQYLKLVRELKFKDRPDYASLRKIFEDLFQRRQLGSIDDDWVASLHPKNINPHPELTDQSRGWKEFIAGFDAEHQRGSKRGRGKQQPPPRIEPAPAPAAKPVSHPAVFGAPTPTPAATVAATSQQPGRVSRPLVKSAAARRRSATGPPPGTAIVVIDDTESSSDKKKKRKKIG